MARPRRNDGTIRVSIHKVKNHRYATFQEAVCDGKTGRIIHYKPRHIGTVTTQPDGRMLFRPNLEFINLSDSVRKSLIYPADWDVSKAELAIRYYEISSESTFPYNVLGIYYGEDKTRSYGSVWLLEQIANKTQIRNDLIKVFENNLESVNKVLTLAYFLYLSDDSFNLLSEEQDSTRFPYDKPFKSPDITKFLQKITEGHRMDLLRLRYERCNKAAVLAIDSTTRAAFGHGLIEIAYRKSKEHLPFAQTVEVVAYNITDHMPVYYRSFSGNTFDGNTIRTIVKELKDIGFTKVILITDRGYDNTRNQNYYVANNLSVLTCAKVNQKVVMQCINELGEFTSIPDSMKVSSRYGICYQQFDIKNYQVRKVDGSVVTADNFKVNLYLDPVIRSTKIMDQKYEIDTQKEHLKSLLDNHEVIEDVKKFRKEHSYFKITFTRETSKILSYELDKDKVANDQRTFGFFASIAINIKDLGPLEAYETYNLRDEQEKYFQLMKDEMNSDRQNNSSDSGKAGRLFVLFVALTLGSYLRYIWKSTELYNEFDSSIRVLRRMKSIRIIEHNGSVPHIISFVGDQIKICDAFGFDIPTECDTQTHQLQQKKRHST